MPLEKSVVLSSTFGWNLCSRLRSGDVARTKVLYCHRLLVGIDALACILAVGLNESAILSSTFGWN